jgi:hypothetical protein
MKRNLNQITTAAVLSLLLTGAAQAAPSLLTWASFTNTTDLSGLTGTLENTNAANIFGGVGSGIAWAGGNQFVMAPDRGPNASAWNSSLDNTTSYISRLHNVTLNLQQSAPNVFNLTPTLNSTTLLYSSTALNYGATSTIVGDRYYFNGRSDNFASGSSSLNSNNARFDPEAVRISADGRYAYVSDEYGPYVYQFDRATGERTKAFALPSNLGVTNLSSVGDTEINGNTTGRVANKGMEGLAISPDGSTLYGFMQSPLEQDSISGKPGDGPFNRIIKIDIESGNTQQFAYNNVVGTNKSQNSSEILAINANEFLVLERDGKGLGDGSRAAYKKLIKIDLTGATDVSSLSGTNALAPHAVNGTLFLDIFAGLTNAGFAATNIPAKLEGLAWGEDVMINGTNTHTLYLVNDNDFVPNVAGSDMIFVFGVTAADLNGSTFVQQAVPEPSTWALLGMSAVAGLILIRSRKQQS